jgi:hypothetical protein
MVDEAVALSSDASLHFTRRGELEALLDAALRLELGHFRLLVRDTSNPPWQP